MKIRHKLEFIQQEDVRKDKDIAQVAYEWTETRIMTQMTEFFIPEKLLRQEKDVTDKGRTVFIARGIALETKDIHA